MRNHCEVDCHDSAWMRGKCLIISSVNLNQTKILKKDHVMYIYRGEYGYTVYQSS